MRILIIVFAFLFAALIAAAITVIGVMAHGVILGGLGASLRDLIVMIQAVVLTIGPAFVVVTVLAFLPTMVVAPLAGFYQLRSFTYYVITRGIVGIVCRLMLSFGIAWIRPPNLRVSTSIVSSYYLIAIGIAAAAGILAGCAHWAIAGRNAGRWRNEVAQ